MLTKSTFRKILLLIFLSLTFASCEKLWFQKILNRNQNRVGKFSLIILFQCSCSRCTNTFGRYSNCTYTHAESRYGQWWKNDFYVNSDGTIDVMWTDTYGYMSLCRISLEGKTVVAEIPIPNSVNRNGRCLGFEN